MTTSLSYYGHSSTILRQLLEEKSRRLESRWEQGFAAGLEEISGLLGRMDPAPSPLFQAIDAKGQDLATYYFTAYSDSANVDLSMMVYRQIKDLVRVIMLSDRFYEVGNVRYRNLGQALLTRLRRQNGRYFKDTLSCSIKQFWPFWKFEQVTKNLMTGGHSFSEAEIRRFNLLKSSDALLIYTPFLETILPDFNHNVSLVMHYNQALLDIEDDLEDVQEDLGERMPNAFILAALNTHSTETSFAKLYKHRMDGSRALIIESAADTIAQLVDEYVSLIQGVQVPLQFSFLKYLSRHYAKTIREKLSAGHTDR